MSQFQLAQVNLARMRAPLTDPLMTGFVARIDEINAIAEADPGFVWRYKDDSAYPGDDTMLFNLSVWKSVEALQAYVYRSMHQDLIRARKQWFSEMGGPHLALWWIPQGTIPTIDDARARIEHLRMHGPTPFAFTFAKQFEAAAAAGAR